MHFLCFLLLLQLSWAHDFSFVRRERNPESQVSQQIYLSEKPIPATRFKAAECGKISRKQLVNLVSDYPNVVLVCEKEQTVLYPAQHNEDLYADKLQGVPQKYKPCIAGKKGCRKYFFTEVAINTTEDTSDFRFPLASCVSLPGKNTSGITEIALSIFYGRTGSSSYGIAWSTPWLLALYGTSSEFTNSKMISLDHLCNFNSTFTRPVLSVSTMKAIVRDRLWAVDLRRKNPIFKFDWRNSTLEVFTSQAPFLSCVSQTFVPGICDWDLDQAKDRLGNLVDVINR